MSDDTSEALKDEDTSYVQPFNEQEVTAWTLAIGLTEELTRATNTGEFVAPKHGLGIRCHEIAHALADVLRLSVQGGWVGAMSETYKGIEHSWLWTTPFPLRGSAEELTA